MVRTLSNAFETGRIPQAWILTGVRGVGKTTTARILARALNYELPDGSVEGPTITMPKLGLHCQAIMESRHIDVIEMDAASHNGVDDVRQINDAIRYAPVSARYKVYILDEVHMLSTQAFNALLKTLEEPPPHAKFIFATTEIRKVPVTVLSRCQRFDLRRVDAAMLVHASRKASPARRTSRAEPEALALIARAAEGSVRDSLSLFDQAIAHAGGHGAGRGRAADAGARRPHPHHRPVRSADEGRHRGGAEGTARAVRYRRRSAGGARRSRRVHPFRHPHEGRAFGRRRRFAQRGRAHARPRACARAVDARPVAHLADAAEGRGRGEGGRPAARRRRDGAGAHRLCRRPADAGRGDPRDRQRRGRRRRAAAAGQRRRVGVRQVPVGAGRLRRRRRVTTRRAALRAAAMPRRRQLRPASPVRAKLRRSRKRACRATCDPHLRGPCRARRRQARHPDRSSRWSATCGWSASRTASWKSRSSRRASKILVNELSRKLQQWTGRPLDGGDLARAGRADAQVAGRRAEGRAGNAGCAPIRW